MKSLNRVIVFSLLVLLALSTSVLAANTTNNYTIKLSSQKTSNGYTHSATINGEEVEMFDYTWHADPSTVHDDVDGAPAEYYTGTIPETDAPVYIATDIEYFPELDTNGFVKVNYDGEQEWVYYYTADEYSDYIFATLPVIGNSIPTYMMHSEEEAAENAVLHITQPGTYTLQGNWYGQILVDLDEEDDNFTDPDQAVTLILDNVTIHCNVAPGVIFNNTYEADNTWEDQTTYSSNVDLKDAGSNVIIADDTVNTVEGTNIYRMLQPVYKNSNDTSAVPVQKKLRKIDGAFYSYTSMNISGGQKSSGVLNINSDYEGLDTELHLNINSGNINIVSGNDGINVNEDGVSVVTFNGGITTILAGTSGEGDGVDSNGYAVVNNGTLIALAASGPDSGIDSDKGTIINGGTVVALGSSMDRAQSTSSKSQPVLNLGFSSSQSAEEGIYITDTNKNILFGFSPQNNSILKNNGRTYTGAIITSPDLTVNSTVNLYLGGNVSGNSDIVDPSNEVTLPTSAVLQGFSSTGFGPGQGNGTTPSDRPTPVNSSSQSDGNAQAQADTSTGNNTTTTNTTPSLKTDFTLSQGINNFSGITKANSTQTSNSTTQTTTTETVTPNTTTTTTTSVTESPTTGLTHTSDMTIWISLIVGALIVAGIYYFLFAQKKVKHS